jgi:hypothetical protein
MARSEHVRISMTEGIYGQRNLLHSQLELLDSMKRFRAYKKLRKEEYAMRILLKTKIEETMGFLDKLDRALPKTSYLKEDDMITKTSNKKDVEPSLQEEIDLVKRKLMRLQGGW